jgi:hypothetical protein
MRSQRGFLAGAPTGFPGPTAIRSMTGGPSLEFQMQCARGRIPESYFVVGKTVYCIFKEPEQSLSVVFPNTRSGSPSDASEAMAEAGRVHHFLQA